jgi:hydroxymethylpyrimidine/phosphomethylpyrimidine kinase
MGNIVPDRFFWALPPGEEEGAMVEGEGAAGAESAFEDVKTKGASRRVH